MKGKQVKPMWGLIIGGIVALIAAGFLIENRISEKFFFLMLCIALAVGLCIAYYGSTKKVTAGLDGFSLEAFENAADEIKQKKLDEIKTEVDVQKKKLSDVITEANKTREDLEKVAKVAAPPFLSLASRPNIRNTDQGGYQVLLQFEPSKNAPFGTVSFSAEILEDSKATIEQLQTNMLCFQKQSAKTDDGKRATTQYVPAKPDGQTLILNVSAPCKVRITCNYMKEPLDLELKNP